MVKYDTVGIIESSENFVENTGLLIAKAVVQHSSIDDFILDTDTSDVRMGTVLSQIQDGVERVIRYFR